MPNNPRNETSGGAIALHVGRPEGQLLDTVGQPQRADAPASCLARVKRFTVAPRGRLAVAVCAPIAHTKGYSALAGILLREAGDRAAAMVEGYFAIGEEAALQRLCKAAGIGGASVLTREGWARFASIDKLVRIEIKGSPLVGSSTRRATRGS